jgi:hypothetical protein
VWWGEVVKCTPVREISGVEIAGSGVEIAGSGVEIAGSGVEIARSGVEIAHPLMYMITNTY